MLTAAQMPSGWHFGSGRPPGDSWGCPVVSVNSKSMMMPQTAVVPRAPGKKIQVGPAPYWTLPALVTPKIRGSCFARETRPQATTPTHPDPGLKTVVWPVSAQPFLLRVTPLPGPAGSEEAQSAQDVLPRGRRAGAQFPVL